MLSFTDIILEVAKGEPIEAVVIGRTNDAAMVPGYSKQPKGVLLSWDEAKPFLGYKYVSEYGAVKCNAIYAWTTTRVLFVSQYDGLTRIESIPRNPETEMPEMPGGG